MKKWMKILLLILAIPIVTVVSFGIYITWGLDQSAHLNIGNVNISSLSDGTYIGTNNNGRWSNSLEVDVENHRVKDIRLVKDVTFPLPEIAEKIFKSVTDNQKVNVDAVSGATVTSKAYLRSIENALMSGAKKQ